MGPEAYLLCWPSFDLKIMFSHENQAACSLTDTDLTYNTMHISYLSFNEQIEVHLKGERCYHEWGRELHFIYTVPKSLKFELFLSETLAFVYFFESEI